MQATIWRQVTKSVDNVDMPGEVNLVNHLPIYQLSAVTHSSNGIAACPVSAVRQPTGPASLGGITGV